MSSDPYTRPPPPPTSHLSNNINPEEKIAAVFANKHIPKLIINSKLEHNEPNSPEEQNVELDEIKPAISVAAQSKDTNLSLETKEPSPDEQNDKLDEIKSAVAVAAASNPPLETKEPSPEPDKKIAVAVAAAESKNNKSLLETKKLSPEQDEKIAVAVAAAESKNGNVDRIRPTHENTNNESQIIINALKQEIKKKENKIVSLTNEKKAAEEAQLYAEIDKFDAEEAKKAAEEAKNIAESKKEAAEEAKEAAESKKDTAVREKEAAEREKDIAEREKEAAVTSYVTELKAKNTAINEKDVAERKQKAAETLLQTKQDELVSTQENLQTTQNELKTTQKNLKTTQEKFKKIQGDRKIVSSDEYKNLTIKFKEYVIYILNEIEDDKNTSSIIEVIKKTIKDGNFENYDINKLKIVGLNTGVLEQYYGNLPNTLSSRERIKLLIIYILSTYECKEQKNNTAKDIFELENFNINDGSNVIKNIYVVCKFLNNFVLDIKIPKQGNDTYTYVNELLMSDLQMYYGIPEYFKEKIDKEEPKLSDIEKCKMYALYVLQNINLDR